MPSNAIEYTLVSMAKNITGMSRNSGSTIRQIARRMSMRETSHAPNGCVMNCTTSAIAMMPRKVSCA